LAQVDRSVFDPLSASAGQEAHYSRRGVSRAIRPVARRPRSNVAPSLRWSVLRRLSAWTSGLDDAVRRRVRAEERRLWKRPHMGLADAHATAWRAYPCAFTLSTGRTGTETLASVLALSPRVVAAHEPAPRLLWASHQAYVSGVSDADGDEWQNVVLSARDDHVADAAHLGKTYVEANARLTFLAPVLARAFPASRFIHLHRCPFEFVRSGMARGYYQGHDTDLARITPLPGDPACADWDGWSAIQKVAWLWARTNDFVHDFFETLPRERTLRLDARGLLNGAPSVISELFDFIDAPPPPAAQVRRVIERKLAANGRRAGTRGMNLSVADCDAVWRIVADVAPSLGYQPPR